MFNKSDIKRNQMMLTGRFKRHGYDWWWHSFTAINEKTKEEKAFYIEFFLINIGLNPNEVIHGCNGKHKPTYLMINVGTWGDNKKQLHRFFPLKEVKIHRRAPFSIEAGDCYLDEKEVRGSVNLSKEEIEQHPEYLSDYGSISFNLKINKKLTFNAGYGASSLFRFLKAFEMYWHAEGMKTLYEGEIYLDGERYIVSEDNSYGYQDKNWGSNFTSPWVWLNSNNLYSKKLNKKLTNSAFDIGGGRPRIFGIPLNRKLLGVMYYEGAEMEFNFAKFWHGVKTIFGFKEDEEQVYWYVTQSNRHYVMKTEITALKKDLLFINYEDPDGKKRFDKLYNGGNGVGLIKLYKKVHKKLILIDEIKASNCGCEYGEFKKE